MHGAHIPVFYAVPAIIETKCQDLSPLCVPHQFLIDGLIWSTVVCGEKISMYLFIFLFYFFSSAFTEDVTFSRFLLPSHSWQMAFTVGYY